MGTEPDLERLILDAKQVLGHVPDLACDWRVIQGNPRGPVEESVATGIGRRAEWVRPRGRVPELIWPEGHSRVTVGGPRAWYPAQPGASSRSDCSGASGNRYGAEGAYAGAVLLVDLDSSRREEHQVMLPLWSYSLALLLTTPYAVAAAERVDSAGNTALILAAWDGNAPEVTRLLESGADPNAGNKEGMTALMASTWGGSGRGSTEVARTLIAHGADVNASKRGGLTALMEVAENGNTEFVSLLLSAGANSNAARADGRTPLIGAALNGRDGIVKALLQAGANPNSKDGSGATALMVAAARGHVGIVEVLLQAGAQPNAADARGDTALRLAKEHRKWEVVRVLQAAGASE